MMRALFLTAIAVAALFAAGEAGAQGVNLSGRWECVVLCQSSGRFADITQYDWKLNVVNEAGQASRAWVDYPGRIWLENANQGAIYAPDGSRIQFDRGEVWVRAPAVATIRRRH